MALDYHDLFFYLSPLAPAEAEHKNLLLYS